MARNEEKAQSMLNRYLAGKQEEKRGPKQKRPFLASECNDLNDADKWRQQILREIGRKVMEIQNAGLGEHRIRDLNDEINKLIREKGHWERRIVELGGVDYAKAAPKLTDSDGSIIQQGPGRDGGYRYFGAAKQLPGVKELFEKEPPKQVKRSRHEMYKNIDADYYGFRDEEDGVLVRLEAEAEAELRSRLVREWEEKDQERRAAMAGMSGREGDVSASGERDGGAGESAAQFVAYVPLPDSKEIERQVLKKKKEDLLARYTSEHLAKQQEEAKTMLNQR